MKLGTALFLDTLPVTNDFWFKRSGLWLGFSVRVWVYVLGLWLGFGVGIGDDN